MTRRSRECRGEGYGGDDSSWSTMIELVNLMLVAVAADECQPVADGLKTCQKIVMGRTHICC